MVKILRWFFGLSWIAGGIGGIGQSEIVAGVLLIAAGLLLLPPTFTLLAQKTGISFGRPIKYIAVIGLFISAISLITAAEDKKNAEKKQQELLAYERLPQAAKDSIKRVKARQDSLAQVAKEKEAEIAVHKSRTEKIEKQFSGYDGSNYAVERAIKQRMNDPDSYEHVATRYIDKGDHIAVITQFRGRNAFNAKILKTATAQVDLAGNVLELNIL